MIRAAAIAMAITCVGQSAQAQQSFEIDQFDITGDVPPQFGAPTETSQSDILTYFSDDFSSSLVVYGGLETREDWATNFEFSRESTRGFGATIEEETRDINSFSFSGYEADGAYFYRYTRFGKTCELETVIATLVYRFPAERAEQYLPTIAPMVASLFIGACG